MKVSILTALLKASIRKMAGNLHLCILSENIKLTRGKLFMQMTYTKCGYSLHA